MGSRDAAFGADLVLIDGDDGISSSSVPAPAREARDWRSLYEQEHARAERERSRADTAEARCEELRRAEVDARARAGSLKWQAGSNRATLQAAREETKEERNPPKNARRRAAQWIQTFGTGHYAPSPYCAAGPVVRRARRAVSSGERTETSGGPRDGARRRLRHRS